MTNQPKEEIVQKQYKCSPEDCPYGQPAGRSWGFSPEGWEMAKEKHEREHLYFTSKGGEVLPQPKEVKCCKECLKIEVNSTTARVYNDCQLTCSCHKPKEEWKPEMIEALAALEHEQWIAWSKALVASETGITLFRRARWEKLWKPYAELTEEEKEQDRIWARKVSALLKTLPRE